MVQLFRSLIFVPGNNARFLEKAKRLDADIVCFDLEDSVPQKEKPAARRLVRAALKSRSSYGSSIFVRTNSPASGLVPRDLEAVVFDGLDGVVIPKVDTPRDLSSMVKKLGTLEKRRRLGRVSLIPSIESAKGVVNAYRIASSDSRVRAIVFGVFDLLNDMGLEYAKDSKGAEFSRAKIPVDAAAAGVASIDGIWQDLKDQKGLQRDCSIGRCLGYSGKSIIHPDQIPTTHRMYHPGRAEIRWAERVCNAYERSVRAGRGATRLDGKMIDEVHFKQARALLDLINKS